MAEKLVCDHKGCDVTDLLIDIGNTRLKWRAQQQGALVGAGTMATGDITLATLDAQLPAQVSQLAWASVAAPECGTFIEAWASARNLQAYKAESQAQWQDLTNGYEQPQQMGVDRWLAMVAAREQFKAPLCVADCGSAITVDYIDASGQHEGSYIIPGQRLMVQALLRDTAKIQFSGVAVDAAVPGKNTAHAVLAGCGQMASYGLCGLLLEAKQAGYVIMLTGGDGKAPAQALSVTYNGDLVLDGLALVAGLIKV